MIRFAKEKKNHCGCGGGGRSRGEGVGDRLEMAGLRNDKENGILTILLLFINGNVFRMRKKKKIEDW